jgi:hypothetical protein
VISQKSLRRDYEIGLHLQCARIAKPVMWLPEGSLVLEYLLPVRPPLGLGEFFRLAVNVTEAVAAIHQEHLIHNAICSRLLMFIALSHFLRYVLYSPVQDCYKLTGFEMARYETFTVTQEYLQDKGSLVLFCIVFTIFSTVGLPIPRTDRTSEPQN